MRNIKCNSRRIEYILNAISRNFNIRFILNLLTKISLKYKIVTHNLHHRYTFDETISNKNRYCNECHLGYVIDRAYDN